MVAARQPRPPRWWARCTARGAYLDSNTVRTRPKAVDGLSDVSERIVELVLSTCFDGLNAR